MLFRSLSFLPAAKVPLLSNERFIPCVLGQLVRADLQEEEATAKANAMEPADTIEPVGPATAAAAAASASADTKAASAREYMRAANIRTQLYVSSLLFSIVYNNQKVRVSLP